MLARSNEHTGEMCEFDGSIAEYRRQFHMLRMMNNMRNRLTMTLPICCKLTRLLIHSHVSRVWMALCNLGDQSEYAMGYFAPFAA